MGYYVVDTKYLYDFLNETISEDSGFYPFKEDIMNIIFLDVDVSAKSQKKYISGFWSDESDEPSQLYLRDTRRHIRIKDLVVDFFGRVMSGELLNSFSNLFSEFNQGVNAVIFGINGILYLNHLLKDYIVKLDDDIEYCIYLQLITHYMEHKNFSLEDIHQWLPREICNMHTKWNCCKNKNDECIITNNDISQAINNMVEKHILSSENNMLRIRY